MPGPLNERTKAQKPSRSSIPFPIAPHPRRQENLRKPEENDKASPRFMAGTTSSSIRSVTPTNKAHKRVPTPHALLALSFGDKRGDRSAHVKAEQETAPRTDGPLTTRESTPVSPPDKPLPGLPLAQIVTTSPPKQSRTLIDAIERPLRVSIGTPDEKEWPILYPSQPSTPNALESFAQLHSIDNIQTSNEMDAEKDLSRMTIKLLTPEGHSETPPGERTKRQLDESKDSKQPATLAAEPRVSDEKYSTTSEPDTSMKSFPRSKAKLVDIPPRHTSPEQDENAKSTAKSPKGLIPRYVGATRRENRRRGMKPAPAPLQLHNPNSAGKKSAIPVAAKSPSSSSTPVAHVTTSSAGTSVPNTPAAAHFLSTIKDDDTVCMDDEPGADTLMRCGAQRRPTYRESARHFQAYSATSESMDATNVVLSDIGLETESGKITHSAARDLGMEDKGAFKLLKNGLRHDNSGRTLANIDQEADAIVLARHGGPKPPIPSRASSHKAYPVGHKRSVHHAAPISDDEPKDTASKLQDHNLTLAQLEGNDGTTDLVKRFSGMKRTSHSPLSSIAMKTPRTSTVQHSEKDACRSSVSSRPSMNVASKTPGLSPVQHKGDEPRSRASVPSNASFRPPVPAKDPTPMSRRLPNKSPRGLAYGVSATLSTLPVSKTAGLRSSVGPETPVASVSRKHKSTARNKLATGLRGLFRKKSTDLKGPILTNGSSNTHVEASEVGIPLSIPSPEEVDTVTTHSKKRMSRHKRTSYHLAEKSLTEAAEKAPGQSDMLEATDIAMKLVSSANETVGSRRGQLLSAASALISAVECMKKANIAREKAEQAAREAAMYQEMMHESLIAINKILGGDGGVAATTASASTGTPSRSGRRTPKTSNT